MHQLQYEAANYDFLRGRQVTVFLFDIPAIRKNCDEFYSLYNDTQGDVRSMCERKKKHTNEVANSCRVIACDMGLDDHDCDMAWMIGLLHDFVLR
ncbi:MAG: hypothetical protein IKO16_05245 [Lachnospiraceae bacterium]|nr:hypothetical protein [Lachnospiraceae bacterium]